MSFENIIIDGQEEVKTATIRENEECNVSVDKNSFVDNNDFDEGPTFHQ